MKKPQVTTALICLLLMAMTLVAFRQLFKCDFVNYDDPYYVTRNPHVQEISARSFLWAFNIGYSSNWHPLTWMSHMLDYRLWGKHAGGHHATSLLFHVANTLLLFLILRRMTRALWQSFFVAALFAIHPLHVESVAWIAERKDVLSTFFWMLTVGAYVFYAERPSTKRYLAVVTLYILGLTAKPMLVTLPLVLLMLDYWPLGRLRDISTGKRIILEKVPLLALAAASSVVTLAAQGIGGAVPTLGQLPFGVRFWNAVVSYVAYITRMLWPHNLAVFYQHPLDTPPIWKIAVSVLTLIALPALVIKLRRPYLLVGWCWYVVTLVPVIGLVQAGRQAMADRYTYVPLIGLFIMIAWGIADVLGDRVKGKTAGRMAFLVAGVVIFVLMACTWIQVGYWRNSMSLYAHALQVEPNSCPAHANLGAIYYDKGDYEEAVSEYKKALDAWGSDSLVLCNYGDALVRLGRIPEAIKLYEESLEINPSYTPAREGIANAKQAQAQATLTKKLADQFKASPTSAPAHVNRGIILQSKGQIEEAITEYEEAIRLDPNLAVAHNNLAIVYFNSERVDEAVGHFREAIRIKPDFVDAHSNLAAALCMKEDYAGALQEVELCRKYGGAPDPQVIQTLSEKLHINP